MKFNIIVLACLGLATLQIARAAGPQSAEAPDFVLKSASGENIRLSEYRGQVVLLSFWASWCGDCRSQLEDLSELHASYQDAGFELLAVSLDSKLSQVRDTARQLGIDYPLLHDPDGAVGRVYQVDSMPLVVLIDREGTVREVIEGYGRNGVEAYVDRVRDLLRE